MRSFTTNATAANDPTFERSTTNSAKTSTRQLISTINQPAFTEDFSKPEYQCPVPMSLRRTNSPPSILEQVSEFNFGREEETRFGKESLLQLPWPTSSERLPNQSTHAAKVISNSTRRTTKTKNTKV